MATWEKKSWHLGDWRVGHLAVEGWQVMETQILRAPPWAMRKQGMQSQINAKIEGTSAWLSPFQKAWLSFPPGLWVPWVLRIFIQAHMHHFSFLTECLYQSNLPLADSWIQTSRRSRIPFPPSPSLMMLLVPVEKGGSTSSSASMVKTHHWEDRNFTQPFSNSVRTSPSSKKLVN